MWFLTLSREEPSCTPQKKTGIKILLFGKIKDIAFNAIYGPKIERFAVMYFEKNKISPVYISSVLFSFLRKKKSFICKIISPTARSRTITLLRLRPNQ